jgi:cytochrome c5
MKYKVIAFIVLANIVYSCATKSSVPTAEVKKGDVSLTPMTSELVEGKSLYENNCARCHQLYSPQDFNAQDWKPIVNRMQKKANLSDIDGQKIYKYLTMK